MPAYFNDAQRQATREAGELAGLEVVRILNEPTAASLTYDPSHAQLRRMLVYDLGGGTFDVSIVQAQEGVVEVLSSHGDTNLGGDDFDDLLLKHVCDKFQSEHGVDLRANLVAKARVLGVPRRGGLEAAIVLSSAGRASRRSSSLKRMARPCISTRKSRASCTKTLIRAADRPDNGSPPARSLTMPI